ncbi:CHAT domain-containing protein [Mycena albidolilacea]|uniref:CHAT domain-containing protein n=1 Tax=Mycena albidolilacea TaxID=1033008 RepID=A0AAD6Z1P6_9AGAR|nr:CHAT domain-containing protein [Mycena albidolilacea]
MSRNTESHSATGASDHGSSGREKQMKISVVDKVPSHLQNKQGHQESMYLVGSLNPWQNPEKLVAATEHDIKAVALPPENNPRTPEHMQSLALLSWEQYRRHGDLKDLAEALSRSEEAVRLTPENDPQRPDHLQGLAVLFTNQYWRLGDLKDLEMALKHNKEAVRLTPEDDLQRAGRLQNLAASFRDQYLRLGDLRDLEAALEHNKEAVRLTPRDDPQRPGCLNRLATLFGDRYQRLGDLKDVEAALEHDKEANLAVSFRDRYQRLGDLMDLEAALQHDKEAVRLTPQDDPQRPGRLQSLAVSFRYQYRRFGDLRYLEAALEHNEQAVRFTSGDDLQRPGRLQNLAVSFKDRYKRLGDLNDLEAALKHDKEAVRLTAGDDPQRSSRLQNLAVSLRNKYRRLGDLKDLEVALEHNKEAVRLTLDDPRRSNYLQDLAISLRDRYQRLGNLRDLEAALEHDKEAVRLTPEMHSQQPGRLQTLALLFRDRYQRLGNLQDLEIALEHGKEAVKLTPGDDLQRSDHLQDLAISLRDRYQRLGDLKDLQAALVHNKQAVNLTPQDDPQRPGCLQSLAISFRDRYWRLGDPRDLEAALEHYKQALELTPEDNPQRPVHLQNLAVLFQDQYQRLGDLEDLEAALEHDKEAVSLTPQDDPQRPHRLQNLAVSLRNRYQRLGDLKDLDVALEHNKEAVRLTPQDNPKRPGHLQNLAVLFRDRYQMLGDIKDLESVHRHYADSFTSTPAQPERSWSAALSWASFSQKFSPQYCIIGFSAAFNLLPEILWLGHSISVRHDAVHRLQVEDGTSTAANTCIALGNLTAAVQFLEQGMATVFQQMLQLRTDVDKLPENDAKALQDLSAQIYTGKIKNLARVVNDRNTLLRKIRSQPTLKYFLLPKPYPELCHAAQAGPIIICNSHTDSCHTILILNPEAEPIALKLDVTLDQLKAQQKNLSRLLGQCGIRARGTASSRLLGRQEDSSSKSKEEQFEDLLAWLWQYIVSPVYRILQSNGIQNGRIWWLPTGAFTSLPLHVCPQTDQFIHSYTTTLGSLIQGQTGKMSNGPMKLSVIGISNTDSKGGNYLAGVSQEVNNILSVVPNSLVECLKNEQATVDAVQKQLQNCSWIHLACHGKQDLLMPTKSRLLLYESQLELETILQMPLEYAQVVFLAACQTATGDSQLVNESFHLGGGFIAAGFQGAVGTMWSMKDDDGPVVAKEFYSYLFKDGPQPQATDAAEALHFAVRELRKQNLKTLPTILNGHDPGEENGHNDGEQNAYSENKISEYLEPDPSYNSQLDATNLEEVNSLDDSPLRKRPKLEEDQIDIFEYDDLGGWTSPEATEMDDPSCINELSVETDINDNAPSADIISSSDEELDLELDLEGVRAIPMTSAIAELQASLDFIQALKDLLDSVDMDDKTLKRLRDPPTQPIDISYSAIAHGSVEMYNETCAAYKHRHSNEDVLSHAPIKKKVAEWSGVMPICSESTNNACVVNPAMKFWKPLMRIMMVYLEAAVRGDIQGTDIVLIGSIDGSQLYRNKKLDCWTSIWIIAELATARQFKVRATLPDSIWPSE